MLKETYAKVLGMGLLLAVVVWSSAAFSQDAATVPAAPPAGATTAAAGAPEAGAGALADQWGDFIHYIRIGQVPAALSFGQAIVQAKPDPVALYRLSAATSGTQDALERGTNLEGLSDTIKAIRAIVEEGYKLDARNVDLIARAIDMLGGGVRSYQLGLDRLKVSGEFAVPQIIARLSDSATTVVMRDRILTALPELGRDAVRPLCEALQSPDATVRETICRTLGRLGYRHAAPYLRALIADSKELESVKAAATSALVAAAGATAPQKPVANLFYDLADQYYTNQESLRPDPRYGTGTVWSWQQGLGLTFKEVPMGIFMDVYAMRTARAALLADSKFYPAVSLWLGANLRKESHLAAGEKDPTRGANDLGADACALAAGTKYMQEVLARALKDQDAAVATGAVRALSRTAGAKNLLTPAEGGAMPLVEALSFPNRRVRFLAAEALAGARPTAPFNGQQLVVTVLVEALRQTGARAALVIEPDANVRNQLKDMLREAGYAAVEGENYASAISAARQSTGVDLVVVGAAVKAPDAGKTLSMLRSEAMFSGLPVVFVAQGGQFAAIESLPKGDPAVTAISAPQMERATILPALKGAPDKAGGVQPMSDAEAADWAMRSAGLIRMLGLTRNPVFDLSQAEPALVADLKASRDALKVECAAALAVMNRGSAQKAILTLAESNAAEPIRVAAYRAAAESVRLIGNQLDEAQSGAVVEVVMSAQASPPMRAAASELLGALNLASEQIKALIAAAKEGQ